jgi:multidrug efflux pump subunit AcrA (membrane-fusion protein)
MKPPVYTSALLFIALVVIGGVTLAVRDRRAGADARPSPAVMTDGAIDARRQQLIGVRTARVIHGSLGHTIRMGGTVQYDETRLTDVNLKLDGWISSLQVNHVGQMVTRGEALFSLYSPDLIAAQNDLIVALKNRDQVVSAQAADAREYGARLVDAPRQRLLRWDVPEDQLRSIADDRQIHQAVVFRSPAAGVVIEKAVINGMHVQAGQTLYKIADLSVVWIEAEFRELDLSGLRVGADAEVTTDAWPGERLSGRIIHIYPYMSEPTRTVKARIALANRGGRLRPGMFANVEVMVKARTGLVVPADAVVDSGTRQIVFVAQGNGHFEPRTVTVGGRGGGQALIVDGLRENEEVAERATFFLDSESQVRAGAQNYEAAASTPSMSPETASLQIAVQTVPSPPRTGENIIEVHVADGKSPLSSEVEVRALFTMPSMPSMNMPAMRSEARLEPVSPGVFRGPFSISMAGRWDVTVSVVRQGTRVATSQTSIVAR